MGLRREWHPGSVALCPAHTLCLRPWDGWLGLHRGACVPQRSARVEHVDHAGMRPRSLLGCGTIGLPSEKQEEIATCPITAER